MEYHWKCLAGPCAGLKSPDPENYVQLCRQPATEPYARQVKAFLRLLPPDLVDRMLKSYDAFSEDPALKQDMISALRERLESDKAARNPNPAPDQQWLNNAKARPASGSAAAAADEWNNGV